MILSTVFDSYWYWFSAALLLLLLEVLIPGAFLMWIGFGAAGVGVFLLLFPTAALAWQLIALAVCVTASVLLGVAWQRKNRHHHVHGLNQGLDSYVGRSAKASQEFTQGRGRVRLDDSFFTAYSTLDQQINAHDQVTIIAVDEKGFHVQRAME